MRAAGRGFSITELLVVITIVVVLAGMLFAAVMEAKHGAQITGVKQTMTNLATVVQDLYATAPGDVLRAIDPTYLNNANVPAAATDWDASNWDASRWNPSNPDDPIIRRYDVSEMYNFLLSKELIGRRELLLDPWVDPTYEQQNGLRFRIDRADGTLYIWSLGPDGEDDDGQGLHGRDGIETKGNDDIVIQVGL